MNHLRTKVLLAAALSTSFVVATAVTSGAVAHRVVHVVPAQAVSGTPFRAAASSTATIGIDLSVQPRNAAALTAFVAGVSTPGSPTYRKYLAKGQFAARFGATPTTIARISAYLKAHGLSAVSATTDRLLIRARGTVPAINRLFHTSIRLYHYKGQLVHTNVTPARIPDALSASVSTVLGLSNVPKEKASFVAHKVKADDATTCSEMTAGTNATSGPFTIKQVGDMYHFNAFSSAGDLGQGQTIGIFELTNYLPSDLRYYQDCVGKQDTINAITVDGGGGIGFGAEVEADLDIEIAATLAPKATLDVYQGPNSDAGVVDTYHRIALDDKVQVTTTSWGLCENVDAPVVSAESLVFAEMAAQGQAIVASAGDNGASDCLGFNATQANPLAGAIGVDDPASQRLVTGVGGTTVYDAATIGANPTSEKVWDTDDTSGTGGGVSTVWPEPSYQVGVPGTSSAGRSVPDISIDADPASGYMIYTLRDGWEAIGGTSAGAPMIATLLALTNEYHGTQLGFVNPLLYSVGVNHPGELFNDVSLGNNETYDIPGFFTASNGFDAPTGWGSPNGAGFLSGDV